MAHSIRVTLDKDLLHKINGEDRMCGKESVIDMDDIGRARFLRDTGHLRYTPDAELTIFPPLPKPVRTKSADEIGEAIADALRKGLVFPTEKKDAA